MDELLYKEWVTGIIPFTYFDGFNRAAGSTFLRALSMVNNATDFQIWKNGHKYDSVIFQKVYWKEMMQVFKGPKILDLCDPDWLIGNVNIIEIGSLADAITCSSRSLSDLTAKFFPDKIVRHVPDRLDFSIYPPAKRIHAEKVSRAVWFGFIHNAHETLNSYASVIKQLGMKLTIIADLPYTLKDPILQLQPDFLRYSQDTLFSQLQDHDIILNPRSSRASYRYKSNNKTIIGWKLGIPVAETPDQLLRLLPLDKRIKEIEEKQEVVEQEYNILRSITQYREIIDEIKKSNNGRETGIVRA